MGNELIRNPVMDGARALSQSERDFSAGCERRLVTPAEQEAIRRLRGNAWSTRLLAEAFGLSKHTVYNYEPTDDQRQRDLDWIGVHAEQLSVHGRRALMSRWAENAVAIGELIQEVEERPPGQEDQSRHGDAAAVSLAMLLGRVLGEAEAAHEIVVMAVVARW